MSHYKSPRTYISRVQTDTKSLAERQASMGLDEPLQQVRSAGSVNMSADLFEKLYLRETKDKEIVSAPSAPFKGFGNPTPIAMAGIVITVTPLAFALLGVLGAGGLPAAYNGTFYFFGGMLQILAGLMDWFLGNTFTSVVCLTYGAFFITFGATLTPSFGAYALYAPSGESAAAGLTTKEFNANFAWFMLGMSVISLLFLVCALRVNVVLVVVFACLVGTLGSLAVSYFLQAAAAADPESAAAAGHRGAAATCLIVAGGFAAPAAMASWYVLAACLFMSLDFPFNLPMGDLSGWIVSGSQRRAAKSYE